tara:strand:+ start:9464 stop:10387 length:924 start_codon:yes stop_codon:yes gene_type:complete
MQIDITVVITCFNERHSVQKWVESFLKMHSQPSEIIVVDSESTDDCMDLFVRLMSPFSGSLRVIKQKCNISSGRNIAIREARNDKIAITDFGVTFSNVWLQEVYYTLTYYPVCSGVYEYRGNTLIQKSYAKLFSPDIEKLDPNNFNPSSRSFGLRRSVVEAIGFYDEKLTIGEDTEFVLRLKEQNLNFGLNKKAVVYWEPRKSLRDIFRQHFNYAYWDAIADQNRPIKHVVYLITLLLIFTVFFVISNIAFALFITTSVSSLIVFRKILLGMKSFNIITLVMIYNLSLTSSALGYMYAKIKKLFVSF